LLMDRSQHPLRTSQAVVVRFPQFPTGHQHLGLAGRKQKSQAERSSFRGLYSQPVDSPVFASMSDMEIYRYSLDCASRRERSVPVHTALAELPGHDPHRFGAAVHAEAEGNVAKSIFTIPASANAWLELALTLKLPRNRRNV